MEKFSNWLWGSSPTVIEPPPAPTIETQIRILSTKRTKLLRDANILGKKAKELYKIKNKAGASKALHQKEQKESQAKIYDGQITNLEQTRMSIESTAAAHDMVTVMKQSTIQMTHHMNGLSVSDVEDVHTELNDLTQQSGELSNALSRQFTSTYDVENEDDIDAQMKEWEDEFKQEETNTIENLLPQTPTHDLPNNNNNNDNTKKYIAK